MSSRPRIDSVTDNMLASITQALDTTKSEACIRAVRMYYAALHGHPYQDETFELEGEKNALCKKRNS